MKSIFFILFCFISLSMYATHNRAGEITYKQIDQLLYEVTVITYTNTLSPADRPELEIRWGDDTKSIIQRDQELYLPNNIKRNKYKGIHSYPGPGTFIIIVEDPNRNYGVQNIPNSVNVVFSIKTYLQINSDIGFNNTPILTTPPIDKAAVGKLFIHNPGAYDPDGDSISYKLTKCIGENGDEIPGYIFPETSNTFYVNEVTGDLIWDAPVRKGIYNVAIFIEEWRNGHKISKIERDMQIEVFDVDNDPPKIFVDDKYCIEADSTLEFYVSASDAENEKITLSAMGGPFLVEDTPASFPNGTSDTGSVSALFEWNTNCSHVRKQPYSVIFKAQDNNHFLNLVCQKNVNIYVIAPAPKNVVLAPTNNTITVSWNPCRCPNTTGYKIYRKAGSSGFSPDICQTGVPTSTGYEQIAQVSGINNTNFTDNNNGRGLAQGYNYCYMVVAYFSDGAESYASTEVCCDLIRGIPVITNVSVNNTDSAHGSVYIAWAKPTELDTLPSNPNGPYKYLIYRSDDIWGVGSTLIDSLSDINDTTFTDTLINTFKFPHSYKIEFYNDSIGKRFLIGAPSIASSVFLKIIPLDNKLKILFDKNVPWQNLQYVVYKQNELTLDFDSINTVNSDSLTDSLLANGKNYCYRVKSIGRYSIIGFVDPIINYSQISCASPIDTVPSCSPQVIVQSFCDSLYNRLTWNNPNLTCANDVIKYNIYYSPTIDGTMQLLDSVKPASNTEYYHYPTQTLAGCYYVIAIDSFQNESKNTLSVCIDSCSHYKLPNIFTPNNDGINDLFKPIDNRFVFKIDLKVYDRWGLIVYQTDKPEINWDGHHIDNGKLVSSGVYYYVCDVYENRLTGLEHRTLLGFVQIIGKEGTLKK